MLGLELAKAELTEKGKQAGAGAGLFGRAGALGLAALGALTACFILALDAVMPAWLAALIMTRDPRDHRPSFLVGKGQAG